uniref:Glycerophosphocholine acyltransferase 1 n=1 Tax=Timspurckia oligopyrenoides TaxID=708627 RepID=A0A7S0ZAR3_9RHOD
MVGDIDTVNYKDLMSLNSLNSVLGENIKSSKLSFKESSSANRRKLELAREELKTRILERRERIKAKMEEPGVVMTIDKVSFVSGILILMVTEFVLLMSPQDLDVLYASLLFPLMLMRYYVYRKDKYHYFMYDFCYFAQVVLLVNLYIISDSPWLMRINFAMTNGPLVMAVVLWRNSLVFHSVDKMTSSFIHMLPPLVTFSQRWNQHLFERKFPVIEPLTDNALTIVLDFIVYPLLFYVLWQALYLFKTEVISRRKLEHDPEIMTSLRWLTKNRKSVSYKVINVFGEAHQTAAFALFQCIYTLITLLIIPLLWHSVLFHALYLAAIFLVALVNGASYYFSVFATRYMDQLSAKSTRTEKAQPKAIVSKDKKMGTQGASS